MDTKVIFFSAVLVFMSFADAFGTYRERRSPMRELQTSLMDIIHGGNVESRIWKRAIPREIRKTMKSNEAIPEPDTYLPPLYDTQPNAPVNSDELSEPETGPPESDPENPHETAPIGKKPRPKNKARNPGIKSPRNTTPKSSTVSTPKPTPSPDPNSISNSDETEDRATETTPKSSVPEEVPVEVKTPRPNVKSRKPTKAPNKPQKVDDNKSEDDEDGDDEKPGKSKGNEEPEEPMEGENEPEENNEDEKEPEENTEDEKEPEENTEDEKEPEENNEEEKEPGDNNEDEKEPEDETENQPASEKPLEDEDDTEEKTEDNKYPKKPTENEDEPEEVSERPEDEKPKRPKSPSDSKRPRQPSSTPKPPRRGTRPTKPPPPFPGDQSPTNTKKPRTESPITYIRPFRSSTTTPQPISTEDPESSEEPADEDDNVDEEPIPSTTPKPKRRPVTRRPPKTPVTPRNKSTPPTTPNTRRKPIEQSPPADIDESVTGNNPNPDDDEYDKDPEETPDDNSDESSDPITTTTTTAKPRTGVKERSKSPTKQRPTKRPRPPKNPPTDPTDEDPDDTDPEPNKRPDVASRFADTKPDTQSPENPDDDTPKSPSKASNRPQNPTFNPMPGTPSDPFQNNPFFSSPFGFGAANSFSSAGSSANAGASASASSSASSNAGVPAWGPWPNFLQNRFADQPMAPSPMFANNPFFRMNNPNDQQPSNSPSTPNSFNNGFDPSKNRPIRGNSSPSPSQSEPRGYTPIISISGSFDANDPSTPSRSSFPSSESTSGSMNEDSYGSQTNFNAPSHGPMADITFDPMLGQMSNPNYGFPSGTGGYSGSSSFSSSGAGGSSLPSEIMSGSGRYPGNNDVRGFPAGSKVQMWPMQDPFSAIAAQNQAMQDSIRASIQAMQQQQEQFWKQFGGGGNVQPSPGFPTYGPNMIGGGQPPKSYNPYDMQTGYQQGGPQVNYRPQQFFIPDGSSQPSSFPGFENSGEHDGNSFAYGSASAGPDGANQMGMISPTGPNVESRFAEDFPTSGGNSYSVFSRSESSSVTGPDGKPIRHGSVTTGVNDNGKVRIKTVRSR